MVLCGVGIALGRMQTFSRATGKVDFVSKVVATVTSPVSQAVVRSLDGIGAFGFGFLNAQRLVTENRRLREQVLATALYTETVERLQRDIEDLRAMEKLPPRIGKTRLAADVVGLFPYENRITVDLGTNQGIKVGMPAESAAGLVGTVQSVDANRAQIQLITSVGLTIGAIDIDRNPPPAGLLKGENGSTLSLIFQDPRAPVQIGDRIETSGFSERIPRGILIGRVIQVDDNPEFGTRRATIFPAAAVGSLREVYILK